MGRNTPCLDCEKRVLRCHATCEDYKEFRTKLDEENKKRAEENAVIGYHLARKKKMRPGAYKNNRSIWKSKKR